MKNIFYILILFTFLSFSTQATVNKVEKLFGDLYSGDIYSGYLNTQISGNELFYLYAPSQNDPDNAPIMLWLNGGPGCSSLFGFLGEIGPVTADNFAGEFTVNPYSWNTNAHLLAIEQPAGVGFSRTINKTYLWTDDVMAENLLAGIKDFLKAFKLEKREFYVSGESYAGVYIPYLATHMINDDSDDKVNLKGVLIGNGLTDYDTDVERSMVDFGFYHGLISIETYNIFKRRCPHKPDELSPEEEAEYQQELKDGFYPRNVTHECNEIRNVIRENLQGSDIYGIYRLCPTRPKLSLDDPLYLNKKFTMKNTILQKLIQYKNKENNFDENEKLGKLEPENDVFPSGCWDDMTIDLFLNEADVKKKLAVYSESMRWTQCFDVNYDMGDSFAFYSEIMKDHYDEVKVWVFSGTEDGVLPTLGTLRWIDKLGFNIETKWRQWKVGKQVAGYVQKYEEGLVVVTVKGAGHMVPQDQRAAAFNMVSAFFKGVLP